jgi:hypothetical protein
MYSLIAKSAPLLSILALLPFASASAELKKVPLILIDTGKFTFTGPNSATLLGDGDSTHLGAIVSSGVFEKTDRPSGGFKGRIEGTAIVAPTPTPTPTPASMSTPTPTPAPSPSPTETALVAPIATKKEDSITYQLSAEFLPDRPGIFFYGVGTYVITGGTGKFKRAKGFGEFIGLANFGTGNYNCFLRGVISY